MRRLWLMASLCWLVGGCGTGGDIRTDPVPTKEVQLRVQANQLWGAEIRCRADGCWLFGVEHEANAAVLHQIDRKAITERARAPVAYHPDGARWIDDRYAVAAVEGTRSLDIFDTSQQSLQRVAQIVLPFEPRNVAVWPAPDGGWWLLALPYSGAKVVWQAWHPVHGSVGDPIAQTWCEEPWYVERWHGQQGVLPAPGLIVACNAAQTVGYVSLGARPSRVDIEHAAWQSLRVFPYRVRQARLTPSQRYLYVTQDLGAQVARLDTQTGQWALLPHPTQRASAVAPLDDLRVAWGSGSAIDLVRYSPEGAIAAHRSLPFQGFAEYLNWYDIDPHEPRDLLVLDLAGIESRVILNPTWP